MMTDEFYSKLPIHSDFSVVSDFSKYSKLPNDWFVVSADIKNSTGAIKAGKYKAVNTVGVSIITAVRNISPSILLPSIFGGDGASLCIPASIVEETKKALIATKFMAEKQFGLHLRVGIVPIEVLKNAGNEVYVARYKMSEHYNQAAFSGGGIEYAENLIKDDEKGKQYRFENIDEETSTDYSGLECRWDNIPSKHGETIALIVKVIASSIDEEAKIYNDIIVKIQQIYGTDDECQPVYEGGLNLTSNIGKLRNEVSVRTHRESTFRVLNYWIKLYIQNILGWFFMTFKLNVAGVFWGAYKAELISNTDFKKFDGVLRQVISGTKSQRKELDSYLKEKYRNKQCFYGIHASDSALMTCMIDNRVGEHFHFIDAADGGYAIAALQMKEQIKSANL
ncbi:MAG: hypothetical protein DHS20C09_15790 [marine bacterium B5-7]|nr:MAG: hypothetical protein DHS20C09_15790 [marine bacterium B5-7]